MHQKLSTYFKNVQSKKLEVKEKVNALAAIKKQVKKKVLALLNKAHAGIVANVVTKWRILQKRRARRK